MKRKRALPPAPTATWVDFAPAAQGWDDRFTQALLISAIVHVLFIFGIQFKAANPKLFEGMPIEVVLVNTRTAEKPLNAEVLAQANLDGGGDVEEDRQARSPLPVMPEDRTAMQADRAAAKVRELEAQARQLMQQAKSSYSVPEPASASDKPPTPDPEASDLAARSLEMARLAARIDQSWDEYQKRPRRAFVGARAQEFAYARYLEDWRLKVERYGNSNYPEAARRNRLYGSLILSIAVRADGSLEKVEVARSSGSRILDAAAINIVERAGPYSAFSLDMRKQIDILDFSRTFTFTRDDQVASF